MIDRTNLPAIDHATRVRDAMTELTNGDHDCDAWLFTDLTDVRWLTGFTGSNGWVVVRNDEVILGTDGRYGDRARAETAGTNVAIVVERRAPELDARLVAALSSADHVGLDARTTPHATWSKLSNDLMIEPFDSVVKRRRQVKDEAEIARIALAAAAADAALAEVEPKLLATIDSPITEADVRDELEYRMRLHGADDRSYETIVASGPAHAARPHHEVGRRQIVEGDTVIIDVGALVEGYHSDMTRSWVIGEPTSQQQEVYDLVATSQRAGLDALGDGVAAEAVDAACREVFVDAGYGDWYLHGTGHGVGLDIHETPFSSPVSNETMSTGMVVTVEPGLYRDGFGGFRIEDLVLVTDTGHRVLTHTPYRPLGRTNDIT